MEQTDLISIITPAYNAAPFIGETIESVLAQTNTHWEMLVVDDGSTDNTADVVKEYANRDPRIIYIHQPNGRQGKARNNALHKAKGNYIAFLDADDLWVNDKLEQQLNFIKQSGVDLVFSNSYFFSNTIENKQLMEVNPGTYSGMAAIQSFLQRNKIPILTVLASKSAILECGGFSEIRAIQNAEDYHLWLGMLLKGKTYCAMDAILAYYRVHPQASTHQDKDAIYPVVEALMDLANQYPAYKSVLIDGISVRMLTYFETNVFTTFEPIGRLLETQNRVSAHQVSIGLWRLMYNLCGYKVFVRLYRMNRRLFSNTFAKH
jgi:teichuronic acid biosynthesis glycosyltransferase TuaG